jgi:ABC-type lipoprotein release transport system permease subunit
MNAHGGSAAEAMSQEPRAVRAIVPLASRLVRHWWRQLAALAAACGVVATTITGALGVGDGMNRGLRSLAVARLGRIEAAVVADEFFTTALVDRMNADAGAETAARLVAAIVIEATVETASDARAARRRSSSATVLGCDDPASLGFPPPSLGFLPPPPALAPDAVLINAVLAESLGLGVGDPLILRVAGRSAVPADSPLGRRTAAASGKRLRVQAVLPRDGLGQFSLEPVQVTRPLVVVARETVQRILREEEVANTIFALPTGAPPPAGAMAADLRGRFAPQLIDYGLALEPTGTASASPLRLTSRRLILPPEADRAAASILAPLGGRPSLVFLANAMQPDAPGAVASIPYSTILGIDSTSLPSGPLVDAAGDALALPGPDEIIIDRWMADDLAAQGRPIAVGDPLEIRFFLPEALHGRIEETACSLRVSGIAAMRGAAVARDLVPEVEGVSDEKSIADWDPPFPFDASRVRTTPPHDEDDRYWKEHGTAPKAFVSLETARRMAGSRFGGSTAWHLPATSAAEAAAIRERLAAAIRPEAMGLRVASLREEALAAARGSTPFGGLFLALSSFVVAAGLLLEWLLFRLLVAARRRDVGILAAIGWPPVRIAWLLSLVGGLAAVAGVVVGSLLGPAWSAVLLESLSMAWNKGVAAGSAQAFGAAAPSHWAIWPGALASAAVSLGTLWAAARRAGRLPPLALLRGASDGGVATGKRPVVTMLAIAGLGLAAAIGGLAQAADPQQAVPLFFLSAVAALAGLLALVRLWLGRFGKEKTRPVGSLFALACRAIAHRPGRAFSVVALVAIAEFLIVAVSSFAIQPHDKPGDRRSPTGGWTHIAMFGSPTGIDPADATQHASMGLSADEQAILAGCTIARIRSTAGSDASCTNLYAPGRPNVLGVGPGFIGRGGFRFAAHAALPAGEVNPWTLLDGNSRGAGPIPCVLDQATAQWALKVGGVGDRFEIPGDDGERLALEIVGLLEPGILQGSVIVGERDFERMFPRRSGYLLALVEAPAGWRPAAGGGDPVTDAIAAAWADAAATVQRTADRFASLAAVQNTFLGGFQALGTLGLLLGTAGLAAVQMQNVLERRGQIGFLRAIGFSEGRVRGLIVIETLVMVGLGLAVGAAAGMLAVMPSLAGGRAAVPIGWIAASSGLALVVAVAAGIAAARQAATVTARDALVQA